MGITHTPQKDIKSLSVVAQTTWGNPVPDGDSTRPMEVTQTPQGARRPKRGFTQTPCEITHTPLEDHPDIIWVCPDSLGDPHGAFL